MFTFKGKGQFKDIHPRGCGGPGSGKRRVDETLLIEWIHSAQHQPHMLIMDNFPKDSNDKVKNDTTEVAATEAVIRGGYTSVLQPLHVSVNKPFKNPLRAMWFNCITDEGNEVRNGKLDRIVPLSKHGALD